MSGFLCAAGTPTTIVLKLVPGGARIKLSVTTFHIDHMEKTDSSAHE